MRFRVRHDFEPGPAFDMTPMVDTVFNLLIFFLMATTVAQAEREMRVALPIAQSSGPISTVFRELVVNIDANGQAYVHGRTTAPEELRSLVTDAVAVNSEQKVTVRGDRHCAYGGVVAVLDICKAAGVQEPYLDTVIE